MEATPFRGVVHPIVLRVVPSVMSWQGRFRDATPYRQVHRSAPVHCVQAAFSARWSDAPIAL
jgi:hypothetical protein